MTRQKTSSLKLLAVIQKEKAIFKKDLEQRVNMEPEEVSRCCSVINQNHHKKPQEYPRIWSIVYSKHVNSFTLYFLKGYENTAYKLICEKFENEQNPEYRKIPYDKQNILTPLFGRNVIHKYGMNVIKAKRWAAYAKHI